MDEVAVDITEGSEIALVAVEKPEQVLRRQIENSVHREDRRRYEAMQFAMQQSSRHSKRNIKDVIADAEEVYRWVISKDNKP